MLRRLKENRLKPQPLPALTVIAAASREVRTGVVYATLVVVLVFGPLFALPGIEGRLFTPLGIAYVVALATFVSYICLSFAQQRLKPTAVSMYNYCQPVIASSVAVMWGMDHFGWMKVLSVLLVFTGVLLVTGTRKKRTVQEQ